MPVAPVCFPLSTDSYLLGKKLPQQISSTWLNQILDYPSQTNKKITKPFWQAFILYWYRKILHYPRWHTNSCGCREIAKTLEFVFLCHPSKWEQLRNNFWCKRMVEISGQQKHLKLLKMQTWEVSTDKLSALWKNVESYRWNKKLGIFWKSKLSKIYILKKIAPYVISKK